MSLPGILAALAAAPLAFVLAELATRAWLARHGRYHVWASWTRQRFELDPEALPMLDPVARFEVNGEGERGAEPPPPDAGGLRVLVAGGSAAECYFLDQPRTWPEVLGRELAERAGRPVHVGNVGRSLVACEHVYVMLERILPRYPRLDAVVFMVGASDVVFWLERGAPAELADDPLPAERMFGEHPEGPFGWGPRTLAMRRVASRWRHRVQRPVVTKRRVGKSLVERRLMRREAERILDRAPDPAPMLDHFERHFRRLLALAAAHSARVVVARQPWCEKEFTPEEQAWLWMFGAGRPGEERVREYWDHRVIWRLLAAVDDAAERIARELGAESVDLNAVVPRDFTHYYDEMHHTPAGCALVGRALAERLAAPPAGSARGAALQGAQREVAE